MGVEVFHLCLALGDAAQLGWSRSRVRGGGTGHLFRVRSLPDLSYFPVFFLLFCSHRSRIYVPALGLFESRDAQPLPGVLRSPWGA